MAAFWFCYAWLPPGCAMAHGPGSPSGCAIAMPLFWLRHAWQGGPSSNSLAGCPTGPQPRRAPPWELSSKPCAPGVIEEILMGARRRAEQLEGRRTRLRARIARATQLRLVHTLLLHPRYLSGERWEVDVCRGGSRGRPTTSRRPSRTSSLPSAELGRGSSLLHFPCGAVPWARRRSHRFAARWATRDPSKTQ